MDVDDVDEVVEDDIETPIETETESQKSDKDDDEEGQNIIEQQDEEELEEARKEQRALLKMETANVLKKKGIPSTSKNHTTEENQSHDDGEAKIDVKSKFDYLLSQSEVFGHFLAGSIACEKSKRSGSNKKKAGRGGKNRMTEAEEDSQLLKTAQSKRRFVRLDKQPSILSPICKMHPYQLEGLNWMIKLHDHGINGILADEMGLGKTLQTISLLAYLREARGVHGPHLVVVPKSVVGNWIREIKKWCPAIKAIRMLGNKMDRARIMKKEFPPDPTTGKRKFDVLVTSYEGILKEKSNLSQVKWQYLIIDEAHRIKNENSSLSKVVRVMSSNFRILITGTPLQNNLHELWALLNFLLPEIFGDAAQFDAWFNVSSTSSQDNVIRKLHTVLRPFMLRRVKNDVAFALPPKKETKLFIGLTKLQQEWYTRILRKDAHELNSLGGPDRVRLLNILMQLRKVCNHPYLFDGAEEGPPYFDGPHIWEACGKMMLLHKLLPKLKERGSRVLIFSQMTRVLDILEDYLRYVKLSYCRIDGNTEGEKRDSQMDEFNAPNSSKFCFLLSTRAGGLGINLATADIVILYDSDWNPQVDLQAMDRAHRIGQKKPVQVFRFVTEGSVEEKIIERADRKLFLDAAVIQQGRLAEQHKSVDKKDLMHMVRFGADEILSSKAGTYTDEDIDALIAKGEERTSAMQAKLQTNAQHNLASFTLSGDLDTEKDILSFEGKNYRDNNKDDGNFINLPQRERKRNYDVNEYYREAMNSGSSNIKNHTADATSKKRRKGPVLQDFQLFNNARLLELNALERKYAVAKAMQLDHIQELRLNAKRAPARLNSRTPIEKGESSEDMIEHAIKLESELHTYDFPEDMTKEKNELVAEGFPDWSKKDFKSFVSSIERYGRFDIDNIVADVSHECGKHETEVKRYYIAFWTNYQRISDWRKVIERIERGEKKILRLREIKDAIQYKVERHLISCFGSLPRDKQDMDGTGDQSKQHKWPETTTIADLVNNSWQTMKFNYGGGYNRAYTEEEDAFLLCMMHRHGYGAAERIRLEIRRAWQFRFDWFFKSRNASEIQKRCDLVIKHVERENEEARKKEEKAEELASEESKMKSATFSNLPPTLNTAGIPIGSVPPNHTTYPLPPLMQQNGVQGPRPQLPYPNPSIMTHFPPSYPNSHVNPPQMKSPPAPTQ